MDMWKRLKRRTVRVGGLTIGGEAPIVVQSMTNTDTRNIAATIAQIKRLEEAGCEIVRVAVPDFEAAQALGVIKREIELPLVADIHFDYRLALIALEQGVDKLRINPGNIGSRDRVTQVVRAAKEREVPIRIGVNGGSLEKGILEQYGHPTAEAMVASAMGHVRILEELQYEDVVISLKASDVTTTVDAYRLLAEQTDYPLHIGMTHVGPPQTGIIHSSVGLGILLSQGLGDTLRVSLTGDPVVEVETAFAILQSLGLRQKGATLVSCPTCGRCQVDLATVASEVERRLKSVRVPIKVAVMGCVVNGPGEARDADIGLAAGRGQGMLFRHGQPIGTVREEEFVSAVMAEVEKLVDSHLGLHRPNTKGPAGL